ncbi:MAG: leucine-rich repeat protein [Oscillospiraceae bacterium]|nr:leucine-rich repeat protein [Oscillospiraceae bacterium]
MKKYLSALISISLFLSTVTITTSAETETVNFQTENFRNSIGIAPELPAEITLPLATSGQCGENAYWEFDGETLYITGEGNMWDYEWVEGENYGYFSSPWFFLSPKYLRISDEITSIGESAFADVSLYAAFIPDSVVNIGMDAFWNPESAIMSMPGYPMNMPVVIVCNEGSVAEDYADGYGMKYITEEVEILGNGFISKDGKKFLYYNSQFDRMDNNPDKNTYYIIPDSVEEISENAFEDCTLTYIQIPETIKTIAPTAFTDCKSLEYLYNPLNNNSEICKNEVKNEKLVVQEEILFTQDFSGLVRYSPNKQNEEYTIPDTVTTIEKGAFAQNQNLKSIIIPDSVTNLGEMALSRCSSLEKITFGNGLKEIKKRTFEECVKLEIVKIPYGVEKIGYYAFGSCGNLELVFIPDTVKEIEESIFYSDSLFTKIVYGNNFYAKEYAETNGIMCIDTVTEVDGVYFSEDMTTLVRYPKSRPAKEYTILDTVLTIDRYAFCGNTNLENITIPKSVTTIDERAFGYCEKLQSIEIPDSVTTMNSGAFEHCSALKSFKLGKGLETLPGAAFYGCESLKDVVIFGNIKKIDESAFNWCAELKTVIIAGSVESIGEFSFAHCNNLKSVRIGESVESIGNKAFEYSYALESVTIPANVTSIGEESFYKIDLVTIYGYDNSYVADYVKNYAGGSTINFVSIGENPPTELVKLVTLNKMMLGETELTPETEYLYDVYQDRKINVLDFAFAKRKLLSSVN